MCKKKWNNSSSKASKVRSHWVCVKIKGDVKLSNISGTVVELEKKMSEQEDQIRSDVCKLSVWIMYDQVRDRRYGERYFSSVSSRTNTKIGTKEVCTPELKKGGSRG